MVVQVSLDRAIVEFDKALRAVFASPPSTGFVPGAEALDLPAGSLERARSGALMRVNHCGEVCAQALYHGQALTCRDDALREALKQAASEELVHLAWTECRLHELGAHKSCLNPLWYFGALLMGVSAGFVGDRWNLGFLAETERQVAAHLSDHLDRLPDRDFRSRAILEQMRRDEISHAETAIGLGAYELPPIVRVTMKVASKAMTRCAYYI